MLANPPLQSWPGGPSPGLDPVFDPAIHALGRRLAATRGHVFAARQQSSRATSASSPPSAHRCSSVPPPPGRLPGSASASCLVCVGHRRGPGRCSRRAEIDSDIDIVHSPPASRRIARTAARPGRSHADRASPCTMAWCTRRALRGQADRDGWLSSMVHEVQWLTSSASGVASKRIELPSNRAQLPTGNVRQWRMRWMV
jgi:hypothetical protein